MSCILATTFYQTQVPLLGTTDTILAHVYHFLSLCSGQPIGTSSSKKCLSRARRTSVNCVSQRCFYSIPQATLQRWLSISLFVLLSAPWPLSWLEYCRLWYPREGCVQSCLQVPQEFYSSATPSSFHRSNGSASQNGRKPTVGLLLPKFGKHNIWW